MRLNDVYFLPGGDPSSWRVTSAAGNDDSFVTVTLRGERLSKGLILRAKSGSGGPAQRLRRLGAVFSAILAVNTATPNFRSEFETP